MKFIRIMFLAASVLSAQVVFACDEVLVEDSPRLAALSSIPNISGAIESLTYKISTKGAFSLTVTLEEATTSACTATFYSRLKYGDKIGSARKLATVNVKRGRRVIRLKTSQLPPVKKISGEIAELHIQGQIDCSDSSSTTEVFARYLKCGKSGLKAVTPSAYVNLLKSRFRNN